jgi:hypothetical protein
MSELRQIPARSGIDNIDVDQNDEVFRWPKQQLIEIAKAISLHPSILILDEPTAALTTRIRRGCSAPGQAERAGHLHRLYFPPFGRVKKYATAAPC